MSRYRLSNVFNDQYTYTYTPLPNPDPEAECFICKTPYSPHDPEGCQAIQLHPCGHIIGHSCFTEWINRTPQSCPYWSHHLPPTLKPSVGDEDLEVKFLRWLVHTKWITHIDHHHDFHLEILTPLKWRRRALCAVEALAKGTLTDEDVYVLTKASFLTFMDAVFRRDMYASIRVFVVGLGVELMGRAIRLYFSIGSDNVLLDLVGRLVWLTILIIWVSILVYACAYSGVTWWVLKLGVRRRGATERRKRFGMQELFWSGFRLGKKSR